MNNFFNNYKNKNKVFIIAEIGNGHLNNLKRIYKLINIASLAGADAIKFQIFSADEVATTNKKYNKIKKYPYNLYERWKKMELHRDYFKKILKYCKKRKIIFMCSVFGLKSLEITKKFNSIIKITSFDLNYFELLDEAVKLKKPILLSTGISDEKEIKKTIKYLRSKKFNNFSIMHCGSSYPLKFEEANLKYILRLKKLYPNLVLGYSDHTLNISSPIAAVALGARVIEKHITISKKDKFPDAFFSLEYKELKEMIKNIREVEKSLGIPVKKITKSINKNKIAMRSYYSNYDLKKNTKTKKGMFKALRPRIKGSLNIEEIHYFLNRRLAKGIRKNEVLTKKHF